MPDDQSPPNEIALEDIIDYGFCPFRVWWRRNEIAPEIVTPDTRRTGEQLVRHVVRSVLHLYAKGKTSAAPPDVRELAGALWSRLLMGWGIGQVAEAMVDYARRRKIILDRFRTGQIRGPGGKPFKMPTWTRQYEELASSMGLHDLRKTIDTFRPNAGLRSTEEQEEDPARQPIGLADAFAISTEIVDQLNLPAPSSILAVQAPVALNLLTTRIVATADLILDQGQAASPGRPTRDGEKHTKRSLDMELHLYDELMPSPKSLVFDLRVVALRNALPAELEGDFQVASVTVRHLRSGQIEKLHPRASTDLDILEGLARATSVGIRAGVYVPRMIHSYRACGDCEHRTNCYEEGGILERMNPPLAAQIEIAQKMAADLRSLAAKNQSSEPVRRALRMLLDWLASNPALATDKAAWFFDAIASESNWDGFIQHE